MLGIERKIIKHAIGVATEAAGMVKETLDDRKAAKQNTAQLGMQIPHNPANSTPMIQSAPPRPIQNAGKCAYCGAPISGKTDTLVECSYCDGEQYL